MTADRYWTALLRTSGRGRLLACPHGFVPLWIAQFVVPYRGSALLLTDLQFLLVGPAWVLASLYRRLGIPSEGGQQERP
jgi:hypothetical protein